MSSPKLTNDTSEPLGEHAVVDMPYFALSLQNALQGFLCPKCNRAGALTVSVTRVTLAAVVHLTCGQCDRNRTVYADQHVGKRHMVNYRFFYAGSVLAQSWSVLWASLTAFGLLLPKASNYADFGAALMRNTAKFCDESMASERQVTKSVARARALASGSDASRITVSIDAQYMTTQGAAAPKGAVEALMDPERRKVLDVDFSQRGNERNVVYLLRDVSKATRRTPLVLLDEPTEANLKALYDAREYKTLEVQAFLGVFSRLLAWVDDDTFVKIIGDEQRTIKALIDKVKNVEFCLDVFHRETKVIGDFVKYMDDQATKNNAPHGMSSAMLLSTGKELRSMFHIATHAKVGTKVDTWNRAPDTLTSIDPATQAIARKYAERFVESYRPYVSLTEDVENPFTFANESLHGHNLRFWSKRVFMTKMWETKCRVSILSWNQVDRWFVRLFEASLTEAVPDTVKQTLQF